MLWVQVYVEFRDLEPGVTKYSMRASVCLEFGIFYERDWNFLLCNESFFGESFLEF